MQTDDNRCPSLRLTTLHQEDKPDRQVYLRCETGADHPGKNHRSWMRKWTTAEEDGRITSAPCQHDDTGYENTSSPFDPGAPEVLVCRVCGQHPGEDSDDE